MKVDQTKETTPFPFVSLGEFRFEKGGQGFSDAQQPEFRRRQSRGGWSALGHWIGE